MFVPTGIYAGKEPGVCVPRHEHVPVPNRLGNPDWMIMKSSGEAVGEFSLVSCHKKTQLTGAYGFSSTRYGDLVDDDARVMQSPCYPTVITNVVAQ